MRRLTLIAGLVSVLSGCGLEIMEPLMPAEAPQAMAFDRFSAVAAIDAMPGAPKHFFLEISAKSLLGKSETKSRLWVRTPELPGRNGGDQLPTEVYLGADGVLYGKDWSPEKSVFFKLGRFDLKPGMRPGDAVRFTFNGALKMDWRGFNPMSHNELIVTLPQNLVMEPVTPKLLTAR